MKYLGIDTAARLTAQQAAAAKAAGVSFVGRYLVPTGYSKALTAEEIGILRNAGLAILLCWEIGAEAVKGSSMRGAQDGAAARKLAEGFGIPSGTTIYFAVDYNIPQADLIYAEQYIKAAQTALGKYEAGMYGPFALVDFLSARGSCRKFWQCVAWSPRFLPEAQTWQYQWEGSPDAMAMAAQIGVKVDMDTCDDLAGAGLWMPWKSYQDGDSVIIEPAAPAQKPWYDEAMRWASDAGLIKDGRPNDTVTRAELATVLYRIYGPGDDKMYSGMLE